MSSFAFIFDLDGTLFDSEIQIFDAINKTRIDAGFAPLAQQVVASLIGLPARELLSDLNLSEIEIAHMVEDFRTELGKLIQKSNPMFKDSEDFIRRVKSLNYKVGVATSKPTYLAEQVIKNSPISELIDHIQGTDGFLPKPEPKVIQMCLSKLSCESGVMFGDRTEDIEAANRAGISSVGLAQSKHSASELMLAGANLVFSSFSEAFSEFDKIIDGLKND